ncbi:MAG: amidohydrolase family protein, partial [Gemmatimonadaceae bacterium]|nr:amidohydrolase family protein [Gemmatimonadaceae bacterium]
MRRSLFLPAALLALAATLPAQETVAIHAARLIDGTGAPAVNDAVVVVAGDRSVAAGRAGSVA